MIYNCLGQALSKHDSHVPADLLTKLRSYVSEGVYYKKYQASVAVMDENM